MLDINNGTKQDRSLQQVHNEGHYNEGEFT